MSLDTSKTKIRNLTTELEELGFNNEQVVKILEWVDTIPIRNYGDENIKVEIKKGTVRINEHLIEPEELSFNNLPHDLATYYLWDNGFLYNPFNLPPDAILTNPFTGESVYAKDGSVVFRGNETIILRNPFNSKLLSKVQYKDDKVFKVWKVNENNEWEEFDNKDGKII